MAIGLLSGLIGLFSALASLFVPGISLLETGAIYVIMVCASVALSVALTLVSPPADSRAY
ncbi:hypothetical protein [Loktanella sp. R86503]|uniref:hypothetical protein n=1 Tax=Loktanella TaxID=245186 RepID=UPI0036DA8FE4